MRTRSILGVIALMLIPSLALAPVLASPPTDPLVTVENTAAVEALVTDADDRPRAFSIHAKASVDAPAPMVAPDTAGNLVTTPRAELGADPELPMDVIVMGSFQPVKLSTVREGETRFQILGPGITPGANAYRQAGSVATNAYTWGDVLEGSQVAPGEFREMAVLGSGYEIQFPERPDAPATGEVSVHHSPVTGVVESAEWDATTASMMDGRFAYRFDVFDIQTHGGDLVADETIELGTFDLPPPEIHTGITNLLALTYNPPGGSVDLDLELERDDQGSVTNVQATLSLAEGTRLHESQANETTLSWTPRVITIYASYPWPNTSDVVAPPSLTARSSQPAELTVHDLSLDPTPTSTHPIWLDPVEIGIDGLDDLDEAPDAPSKTPALTALNPTSMTSVGGGDGSSHGDAPGLSGLKAGELDVGDVALAGLRVDGDHHALTTEEVDGPVRVTKSATGQWAVAHAPVFAGGHFVDLYALASGSGSSLFVQGITNEIRALDQASHDVELTWFMDADVAGSQGNQLWVSDFARLASLRLDDEAVLPMQTGMTWAKVEDPDQAPGAQLHTQVLMPTLHNSGPRTGGASTMVAVADGGQPVSDPLGAAIPPEALDDAWSLYALTGYEGAFSENWHWLWMDVS